MSITIRFYGEAGLSGVYQVDYTDAHQLSAVVDVDSDGGDTVDSISTACQALADESGKNVIAELFDTGRSHVLRVEASLYFYPEGRS